MRWLRRRHHRGNNRNRGIGFQFQSSSTNKNREEREREDCAIGFNAKKDTKVDCGCVLLCFLFSPFTRTHLRVLWWLLCSTSASLVKLRPVGCFPMLSYHFLLTTRHRLLHVFTAQWIRYDQVSYLRSTISQHLLSFLT